MNKITLPFELESDEHLIALQAVLNRAHAHTEGVEQQAVAKALSALNRAAALLADQAIVDAAQKNWVEAQGRLALQAGALARQLKKGISKGGVAALAALHHLAQTQMQAGPVFVDSSDFALAEYRARPAFWLAVVKASQDRQDQLADVAKGALAKMKAEPAEPYPVPTDGVVAKAAVEAWSKAVSLIRELGDSGEELNHATLYEAAVYATYARAFATDDVQTVAKHYRQARRDQDSLLRTFSDAMTTVAGQFTEREGLAWHADHVSKQRKPGPR